jgi:thiol-disulfide isomerase/thioredoxin
MKITIIILVVGMLCVGGVSAMSVNFFYNENCPHCAQVYPFVIELSKYYPINFLDISKGSYNIQGVPTIIIKTLDNRKIELVGSQEIPAYLKCELQEMTTRECPTYGFNEERQSWFIK